jgi:hypothetical protein
MITGMDILGAWVRGLYRALGWRVVSDVVPAHVPEGAA